MGGTSNRDGRLEICNDNVWGTVCDDSFTPLDANVACRQLGFSSSGTYVHVHGETIGVVLCMDIELMYSHEHL